MALLSFKKQSPQPVVRNGVTAETLAANNVVRINASDAKIRYGSPGGGVVFPYHHLDGTPVHRECDGQYPLARLRLNVPEGDQKYHQKGVSKPHLYMPRALGEMLSQTMLHGGDVLTLAICEGEAKSLSLCEFGVAAAGVGGINGALVGGELVSGLGNLLQEWPVQRIVFLGDSDVGINHFFSKAAVALARAVSADVAIAVIAPGLAAPGKGIDDCRHELQGEFASYWAKLKESAIEVGRKITADELALQLLRREDPAILRAIYRCESWENNK